MEETFDIMWKDNAVNVQTFEINNQRMFRVMINPPIVILRANHEEGYKFWTSIPAGNRKQKSLARLLNNIIDLKNKRCVISTGKKLRMQNLSG